MVEVSYNGQVMPFRIQNEAEVKDLDKEHFVETVIEKVLLGRHKGERIKVKGISGQEIELVIEKIY